MKYFALDYLFEPHSRSSKRKSEFHMWTLYEGRPGVNSRGTRPGHMANLLPDSKRRPTSSPGPSALPDGASHAEGLGDEVERRLLLPQVGVICKYCKKKLPWFTFGWTTEYPALGTYVSIQWVDTRIRSESTPPLPLSFWTIVVKWLITQISTRYNIIFCQGVD